MSAQDELFTNEDVEMEAVDENAEMCQGKDCYCDRCIARHLREAQLRVLNRAMHIRDLRIKGRDRHIHKRKLNAISESALEIAENLSINDMTPEQKKRWNAWTFDSELAVRPPDNASIELGRIPEGGSVPTRKACSQ